MDQEEACCGVELERVATLTFTDAPSAPTPMFSRLEQLPDSSFILSVEKGEPALLHFEADGSYVDAHLRVGQGPGEIANIDAILVEGDSVWLIDQVSNRCNLYDSSLAFVRYVQCFDLKASDIALVGGRLYATGFGPLGLVEIDPAQGDRRQAWESDDTLASGQYPSLAAGSQGVWFVPHPHKYRIEHWAPGEDQPDQILERSTAWWKSVAELEFVLPDGSEIPGTGQNLAGPLLWNVGVGHGFVWTASYVLTRARTYPGFLDDWVNSGLQGDVRVFVEALGPSGELVASQAFDNLAPPRFTSNGLLYSAEKSGLDVQIAVYRPRVVTADEAAEPTGGA